MKPKIGRNRLIKFNDQMNKEARMLWLEIELQKALQQNGLEVWYQPKVNARVSVFVVRRSGDGTSGGRLYKSKLFYTCC